MDDGQATFKPLAMNKEQAAAVLSVPVDTVLNLTRTGQLRSIMIGKHRRWLLDDLKDFVERQRDPVACVQKAG